MKQYAQMSVQELSALRDELNKIYEKHREKGKKLNMTRGVPSNEQLSCPSATR